MHDSLVRVKSIIEEMAALDSTSGGFLDIIEIRQVVFGDPPKIQTNLYPIILVEPDDTGSGGETTGYYKREHRITVSVFLNAPEYFSRNQDTIISKDTLSKVIGIIDAWFQNNSRRVLEGLPGVESINFVGADYSVQRRLASANVKGASITFEVLRKYMKV